MKSTVVIGCVAALIGASASAADPPGADISAARIRVQSSTLFGVVEPVTASEIASPRSVLGRALFWDERISIDGKTACASCHAAKDWSSDHRRNSIDAKGKNTNLHSQPMFMAQDQVALRWYGDRRDGTNQAERSITGSMGFAKVDDVVPVLKGLGYEAAFRAAYPNEPEAVTPLHYAQAMEAYQRTLRTPAPFDAFLQGNDSALTRRQVTGLEKFVAVGCVVCHRGPLLGGNSMQKFGVVKDYWLATGSSPVDMGRFNATKQESDKYVYRVPMLRNITKTAPYFHDGSVARLEDAVRIMAEVQLGRLLSDADVADIVAFLGSLTGTLPAHYAPPAKPVGVAAGK